MMSIYKTSTTGTDTLWLTSLSVLVSILLRCCTSLHSYSGQNTPPMYGDYEAQRHWMEITVNLPVRDWYRDTPDNDLLYWGLDYPPLTAYHSLACGYVAKMLNPKYVALNLSRGYESHEHKVFMRYTVLFTDIFIYITAFCFYFYVHKNKIFDVKLQKVYSNRKILEEHEGSLKKKKRNKVSFEPVKPVMKPISNKSSKKHTKTVSFLETTRTEKKEIEAASTIKPFFAFTLAIIYPGIILVDHGHFQYNSVSLGLTVYATTFLMCRRDFLACIFFVLALNHKQMELYHSLPFFFYMLGVSLKHPKPLKQLVTIAGVVSITFILIWIPFFWEGPVSVMHVVYRLFPFSRGVFEDKVANFWCALDIIVKLKKKFDHSTIATLCTVMTLIAAGPSGIDLLRKPGFRRFILSLINISFAFFLFSFHVHEKSILLVAIPALLYLPFDPMPIFWFLFISTFSMLPLLIRDGLLIATIALTVFFYVSFDLMREFEYIEPVLPSRREIVRKLLIEFLRAAGFKKENLSGVQKSDISFKRLLLSLMIDVSVIGCVIQTLLITIIEPPLQFPDLYPLLIALYSFIHFAIFFVYFNYCQLILPDECAFKERCDIQNQLKKKR